METISIIQLDVNVAEDLGSVLIQAT